MGVMGRIFGTRAAGDPAAMPYLIVGLGNPEKKYEGTRHNVGFEVLDELASRNQIRLNQAKFRGMTGSGMIKGHKVVLLKPLTYMNLSGEAVGLACNFYKIDPATHLIVLYDDIALPVGQLRVRPKGSAGGHNGIKNIISHLSGSDEFLRVRVGVGQKPEHFDRADWVLSRFDASDREIMRESTERAAQAAEALIDGDVSAVMSAYNRHES